MKASTPLRRIDDPSRRSFLAGRATALVDELRGVADRAGRLVDEFAGTGDAEKVVDAMRALAREPAGLAPDASWVASLAGLTTEEERSRLVRARHAALRVRQWREWEAEIHAASAARPEAFLTERQRDGRTVVYHRGKRIGYVVEAPTYGADGKPVGAEMTYWVEDPFKVSYRRPHHSSMDEAVERLALEIRRFID